MVQRFYTFECYLDEDPFECLVQADALAKAGEKDPRVWMLQAGALERLHAVGVTKMDVWYRRIFRYVISQQQSTFFISR